MEFVAISAFVRSHHESRARTFAWFNQLSYQVFDWRHQVNSYFDLRSENDLLREENALLRSALYAGREKASWESAERYDVLDANIIMMTRHRQRNYFTLDIGSLDGVAPEMGVIGQQGIMGKVVSVSPHYALCKSILHKDIKVSVSLEDSLYFGTLSWNGARREVMQLSDIPVYADPQKGERVFTNSFSSIFPAGVEVGTIIQADKEQGTNYLRIDVALVSDQDRSGTAYVVRNIRKEERFELEENQVNE
jgi:rod shape-determining protein MreC